MPKDLENALENAGEKEGLEGPDLGHFVYGTMTNMQKKGSIPAWRTLRGSSGKMGRGMGHSLGHRLMKGLGMGMGMRMGK